MHAWRATSGRRPARDDLRDCGAERADPVDEAIRRCEEIVARELGDRQAEGLVLCAAF